MSKKPLYIMALSALVSSIAILLPEPLSRIGFLLLFTGVGILIVVSHRATFRQHKHGMLSQYTDVREFIGMRLNLKEFNAVMCGIGLSVGFLLGVVVKVSV